MTNDQDSTANIPFQVVLIDIKKAANEEIHCVKKPLTEELKYVAISYRWGELSETTVDTNVGYLASITSFDVKDFYKLCKTMTKEPDFRSMDYVWVDAICVNQSNYDERKATVYHMSEIYEQATWILAVPDLHVAHLRTMANNKRDLASIEKYSFYLYHLIHGNTKDLHRLDKETLDKMGVPPDQKLRELLTTYTHCFANGFMQFLQNSCQHDDTRLLHHLYDLDDEKPKAPILRTRQTTNVAPEVRNEIRALHQCHHLSCPFDYIHTDDVDCDTWGNPNEWHRHVLQRSMEIRQAMHFLTDLVVDWSSRVWVISEFRISKKKNNLKIWFNQLGSYRTFGILAFFKFDINDPRFTKIQHAHIGYDKSVVASEPVYLTFYKQLINQLNRQSIFEMMLKSKASRNEDRFHAIFPFFPHYKHLLQKEELVTNMNSIVSVKLKLYQVMTNKDKLLLLYLSSQGTAASVLPTFATAAIDWTKSDDHLTDNTTSVDITLLYQDTVGHYLLVKPTMYAIRRDTWNPDAAATKTLNRLLSPKTLRQDRGVTYLDMVLIFGTTPRLIMLIGSFNENIWILKTLMGKVADEMVEDVPDDFPGFRVY